MDRRALARRNPWQLRIMNAVNALPALLDVVKAGSPVAPGAGGRAPAGPLVRNP
jgi:hypothetical protein